MKTKMQNLTNALAKLEEVTTAYSASPTELNFAALSAAHRAMVIAAKEVGRVVDEGQE